MYDSSELKNLSYVMDENLVKLKHEQELSVLDLNTRCLPLLNKKKMEVALVDLRFLSHTRLSKTSSSFIIKNTHINSVPNDKILF